MRISGFISKAACRGYRPNRFASYNGRQRPHLIARLARERSVVRFVVAPVGYGKTSLAIDYAETMFEWVHVFWLNAASPCFIRDLDNADIASACVEIDPEAKLVVIDDLPQLDAARVERLSDEIDILLEHECEVIVLCTPSCYLFDKMQPDRLRIGPADMLLTDKEVDAGRSNEERLQIAAAQVPIARRIPLLEWGEAPEGQAGFITGCLSEDIPSDLLLAMCSAFALRRGSIGDLTAIGPVDVPFMVDACSDYPHLGFDREMGRFEAPLIDAEILARAMRGRLGSVIDRSRCESGSELVQAWAAILLEQGGGAAARACDLVRSFLPVPLRAAWLLDNARTLVACGCFAASERLARSLRGGRYEDKNGVLAFDALCHRVLGDEDGAISRAKRCAFETRATTPARVVAQLILARCASGVLRDQATDALQKPIASSEDEAPSWYEALAMAWTARSAGVYELAAKWSELRDEGVDDDALCVIASWLFAIVGEQWDRDAIPDASTIEVVERFVRERLYDDEALTTDFCAVSAGLSMEEAHMKGYPYCDGPLEAAILLELRRVEMAMYSQRRQFEQGQYEQSTRRMQRSSDGSYYGERLGSQAPRHQIAVPTLEIKLFGHLEVKIGGEYIDQRRIGRKQARVLLVLLAANRGRDLSRDSVAQTMWPTRDLASARKNFYTAWSQLRHALTLSDGTCPYLARHQFGCRLDERYVRSDLARLDDICRELLFGRLDFDAWTDLYNEIDRDFSGELLPLEESSPLVAKVRDEYRNRLVDALVGAAQRLIEAGSPQWAIWFSRAAIDRQPTREDAHVTLMRAQIAHEQRTAAMMTYLNCRRILGEELGIDPSPEMNAIYESLLNG